MLIFKKFPLALLMALAAVMVLAQVALAAPTSDDPANPVVLLLPTLQLATIAVGLLVPLVTYVLNHAGPWVTEPTKAVVLVVASAVAGGLTEAIATGSIGFDAQTWQLVLSSVAAALTAHKLLWKPSTISTRLGGGSNRQE